MPASRNPDGVITIGAQCGGPDTGPIGGEDMPCSNHEVTDQDNRSFATLGFAVIPDIINASACDLAAQMMGQSSSGAGSRSMLQNSWCQELALKVRMHPAIHPLLPEDAVAVQCAAFDKSPSSNWLVALHQDRSIPVRCKTEGAGLSGWSQKEGDLFVQPPAPVLEQITAVRVHLDPCPLESGALHVVPGSHRSGLLATNDAQRLRALAGIKALPVPRGGALVLKPLLLHASSKATEPLHRRVLHFVFGPRALPMGLQWPAAVDSFLCNQPQGHPRLVRVGGDLRR